MCGVPRQPVCTAYVHVKCEEYCVIAWHYSCLSFHLVTVGIALFYVGLPGPKGETGLRGLKGYRG